MVLLTVDIPCKLLRANHVLVLPVSALYFDTETGEQQTETGSIHRMKLAWTCRVEYDRHGAVRKQRWMEWKTAAVMCRWIAGAVYEKTSLWVFAHNAFFDLQASGWFEWFTRDGWVLQFVYEAGLTYILVIRKEHKTIKIVSTTNYFKCTLKKLGSMIGLEKLDADFGTIGRQDLSDYCRRDVEIVRKAMESYFSFIRTHDLGSFSMTIPSQAMRAFRHRFMKTKVFIHRHEEVQRLEQDSYFGGRTECFQIGKVKNGPFATLDVNSMYPSLMASKVVPVQLVDFLDHPALDWLEDALRAHCVIARCDLETQEPIYPVRFNQRVCFPVGRFSTVLCTEGLRTALARGHLLRLGQAAVYRSALLFSEHVNFLYPLKSAYSDQGQDVWAYLCKMLLNGLYGKWAQRRPILEGEDVVDPAGYRREEVLDLVTGRTFIEYQLMNRLVSIQDDEPASNSFAAISAHITEAARMKLWSLIETAGPERVLYCDTDSLKMRHADVGPLDHLIHPNRLGALKVERVSDDLEIWGLKAYSEDGLWKIKGIPRRAKHEGGHVYSYHHFLKQASHMRRQQITGMISETMRKKLKLVYEKGTVNASGRVAPFRFGPDGLPSPLPSVLSSCAPSSLLQ